MSSPYRSESDRAELDLMDTGDPAASGRIVRMSSFEDSHTPRQLADAYVHRLAQLEPQVATALGLNPDDERMPDYSPARQRARTELGREVLARLDELQA